MNGGKITRVISLTLIVVLMLNIAPIPAVGGSTGARSYNTYDFFSNTGDSLIAEYEPPDINDLDAEGCVLYDENGAVIGIKNTGNRAMSNEELGMLLYGAAIGVPEETGIYTGRFAEFGLSDEDVALGSKLHGGINEFALAMTS